MDDASWAALTLSLTVLGGIWTFYAFRRRGVASGIRGIGLTLLPLAAYLTNTLRMFTRIVDAVADWAGGLALSPKVWVGIVVAGVAVLAFAVARAIEARTGGRELRGRRTTATAEPAGRLERRQDRGAPAVQDDDMAEIEALLRQRGIS